MMANYREQDFKQHLLVACGCRRDFRLYRQNNGKVAIDGRYIQMGIANGCADLTGITDRGIRLEVECKSAIGKQHKAQIAWGKYIQSMGGIYLVVAPDDRLPMPVNVANAVAAIEASIAARHLCL